MIHQIEKGGTETTYEQAKLRLCFRCASRVKFLLMISATVFILIPIVVRLTAISNGDSVCFIKSYAGDYNYSRSGPGQNTVFY